MTQKSETPERIILSPHDAKLFGNKYGHPKIGFGPCVGDPYVEYLRTDAQTALAAHDKRVREKARQVKPLEWLERRRFLEAGPYQVCCNGSPSDPDAMYRVRFHGKVICPQVKGVDRAVAWANEHHQRGILSALIEKDQTDDDG